MADDERVNKQAYGDPAKDTATMIYSKDGRLRTKEEFDNAALLYNKTGQTPPGFIATPAERDRSGNYVPSGLTATLRDFATRLSAAELPAALQPPPAPPQGAPGTPVPQQTPSLRDFALGELGGLAHLTKQLPLQAVNEPLPMAAAAALTAATPYAFGPRWLARSLGAAAGTGFGTWGQSKVSGERIDPADVAMDMLLAGGLTTGAEVLLGFGNKYLKGTARDKLQEQLQQQFVQSVPGLQNNPQLLNAQASRPEQWRQMLTLSGKTLASDAEERAALAARYIQADTVMGIDAAEAALAKTLGQTREPLTQRALHPQLQTELTNAMQKITDRTHRYIDNILQGKDVPETLIGYLDSGTAGTTPRDLIASVMERHMGLGNEIATRQIGATIEQALTNYSTIMKQSIEGAHYLKMLRDAAGPSGGFNPTKLAQTLTKHVGEENAQAAAALRAIGWSPLGQMEKPALGNIGYQIMDKLMPEWAASFLPPAGNRALARAASGLQGPQLYPSGLMPAIAGATQVPHVRQQVERSATDVYSGIRSFLPRQGEQR